MRNLTLKLALIIIGFALNSFNANAQKKLNFDEEWKFHFGHAANPEKDFNYSTVTIFSKSGGAAKTAIDPKFVDSTWTSVNVPHDWAVELPFENSPNFDVESHGYKPVGGYYPDTSIGWYRKHFIVDKADSNKRFEIQFDGIFRNATIWVNGFFVGNNFSGYVGKSYDVTDYLLFDKENVIVVRVDATQYEGWFYEGAGIYRHVWLNTFNNLHIPENGLFVHASVNGKNATVEIETEVENKNFNTSNCIIYSYITDRNGKQIAKTGEQKASLYVNKKQTVKQKLTISNAHLWSLEDPYLYKVVSVIKQGNDIVYTKKDRFGVRTIRFDATEGFFLNGKHIKIQGTNNHQDHAGIGSALPDYMQYYRIKLLKEMGSNAYRASHNAPTPELLEACEKGSGSTGDEDGGCRYFP